MGRHKNIVDVELSEDAEAFYINHAKSSITQLAGKHINHFVGETYEESLSLAFEWVKLKNNDENCLYTVELVDFYPQIMGKKAILISYNITYKVA